MGSNFSPATPIPLYGITAHQSAVGASSTGAAVAGSFTIPANTLVAGDRLSVRFVANTTAASTPNLSMLFRISDGSTTHTLMDLSKSSLGGTAMFFSDAHLSFLTVGSSGKVDWSATGLIVSSLSANAAQNESLDTTAQLTVDVRIQFNASNVGNTVTIRELSGIRHTNS